MAINYSVQANIVDIRTDQPKKEDVFFVDTNVWYWTAYPNACSPSITQLSDYPKYLNDSIAIGAKIFHCGLSLSELAHQIEKTEREIFQRSKGGTIKAKEFRHNFHKEHSGVVREIQAAWGVVKNLAQPLSLIIDEDNSDAVLKRFNTDKVDGYDLFFLETMRNNGVIKIISDDGDFSTVAGITLFTANSNVINASKIQNKFLTR